MKILVTGGTGFIGAHLSNFCLNKENTVHICDNNIRGTKDEFVDNMIHHGAKFIKCDLTKKQDLDKLDDDYDVIFHFAAINGTEGHGRVAAPAARVRCSTVRGSTRGRPRQPLHLRGDRASDARAEAAPAVRPLDPQRQHSGAGRCGADPRPQCLG